MSNNTPFVPRKKSEKETNNKTPVLANLAKIITIKFDVSVMKLNLMYRCQTCDPEIIMYTPHQNRQITKHK